MSSGGQESSVGHDAGDRGEGGSVASASLALPPGADPRILGYRRHVEHFDMPEREKLELLHLIWGIMRSFVDRAFGDDPVQQVGRQNSRAEGRPDAEDAGNAPSMVVLVSAIQLETDSNELTGAFRDHAERGGRRK